MIEQRFYNDIQPWSDVQMLDKSSEDDHMFVDDLSQGGRGIYHSLEQYAQREVGKLPYGNGLGYILRHGQPAVYGETEACLSPEGARQILQSSPDIKHDLHKLKLPIDFYYWETDRRRSKESLSVLWQDIIRDFSGDGNAVLKTEPHPLLNSADHIHPLFRAWEITPETKHTVLSRWLDADADEIMAARDYIDIPQNTIVTIDGKRQQATKRVEVRGTTPSETLQDTLMYFSDLNQRAFTNPDRFTVDVGISHEPTFAAIIQAYFPDLDPQPNYAEVLAINTGNIDHQAELVFRGQRVMIALPPFDSHYIPRMISDRYREVT